LIGSCVDALRGSVASGFELVFVDETDGERIAAKWEKPLDKLGLMPDINSLWPDAILVRRRPKRLWFVDAVKTDGEIDEIRAQALRDWAKARGFQVAGMTTAYETWRDVARRQGKHKNLALGTTLWVAEDGGKLLNVESAVE
jgi:BsuBI/PstI restriction endonuclease domain